MRRPVVCGAEEGRSEEKVSVGMTGCVLGARVGGAATGAGGGKGAAGRATTTGGAGAAVAAAGGVTTGLATTGAEGGGAATTGGGATTATGGAAGAGGGTATTGGRATTGRWVKGGAEAPAASACLRSRIARAISPGFEALERSIRPRVSAAEEEDDRELDEPPLMWRRTSSASPASMELEWVFFSATPTAVRASRMDLLFTSSSRARSLMRTLLNQSSFCSPAPSTRHSGSAVQV